MARVKRYIDADVYTEAKRRLAHIMETHDAFAVMFSGGKDSLVTLHLTREVMLERGRVDDPLHVVFRDEELIQQEVIDFVDGYRRMAWIKMLWLTVPLASHKYVLGVSTPYVQWDPGREWVREKPAWGSRPRGEGLHVLEGGGFNQCTNRRNRIATMPAKVTP